MIFKHSGDIGDLIYCLPVIKGFGGGELKLSYNSNIKNPLFKGFNENILESLRPLLLRQSYIYDVGVYKGEEDVINLDRFKELPLSKINICKETLKLFGLPLTYALEPWLFAESLRVARVIFHRSLRYQSKTPIILQRLKNYLNKFRNSCVFVGFKNEWESFCETLGEIVYYPTDDFWKLACVIAGADIFIGNQSAPMAIAIGLGKPYVQEVCRYCPNCIFYERCNTVHLGGWQLC